MNSANRQVGSAAGALLNAKGLRTEARNASERMSGAAVSEAHTYITQGPGLTVLERARLSWEYFLALLNGDAVRAEDLKESERLAVAAMTTDELRRAKQ